MSRARDNPILGYLSQTEIIQVIDGRRMAISADRQVPPRDFDAEFLAEVVDAIIESGIDPEAAHVHEDNLHHALIEFFCPDWVKAQINRLTMADFARWYA